jgi:MFS family permease
MAASLYSIMPFGGPLLGPIIGGYISVVPALGWRFTFWILMIMSAVSLISSFLLVPETVSFVCFLYALMLIKS